MDRKGSQWKKKADNHRRQQEHKHEGGDPHAWSFLKPCAAPSPRAARVVFEFSDGLVYMVGVRDFWDVGRSAAHGDVRAVRARGSDLVCLAPITEPARPALTVRSTDSSAEYPAAARSMSARLPGTCCRW